MKQKLFFFEKFFFIPHIALIYIISSCCDHAELTSYSIEHSDYSNQKTILANERLIQERKQDARYEELGLIDVQKIDSTIQVELKYTTSDNFLNKVLYTKIRKAYLQGEVAIKLKQANSILRSEHPNFNLLVYDAVRPVDVQILMWESLDTIPIVERVKFVSNPNNRSLHNFGAAIDLTIMDSNGKVLDMGAGYDDSRKIAYPSMEYFFLKNGLLSKEQHENRLLLRRIMREAGFTQLQTEWWHYNSCSRFEAKTKYPILQTEL